MPPAVLIVSVDRAWLAGAAEAVVRAGGVIVAECPDAVSVLAQASLDLADVVLVDPRTLDFDRDAVLRLRRRDLVVAAVSTAPLENASLGAPCFEGFAAALEWASGRAARLGVGPDVEALSLVAVFGVRGAPGASTLAVALAKQRAVATSGRCALLDLDTRGGDIAALLGLTEDLSVVVAAEAVARDQPWRYTTVVNGVAMLVAPSRPTWSTEVAPVDIGAVLDAVTRDRLTVVDAGCLGAQVDDVASQILVRTRHIILVSRADRVAFTHLVRATSLLRPHARELTIVINLWRGEGKPAQLTKALRSLGVTANLVFVPEASAVDAVASAVFSGTEEKHQAGRRVEKHQDRHRHAGRGLRARWPAR